MKIIFSTCWYVFKAKFDPSVYQTWIDNMLKNVNNYFLVIYTDSSGLPFLTSYMENPRILIILKSVEEFWQYRHKENWIRNHSVNYELNTKCSWELNMLWSEKIHFVRDTIRRGYFISSPSVGQAEEPCWYGWCDIGYFRPNDRNLSSRELEMWPNPNKLEKLDASKIHYALVNPYIGNLIHLIQDKTSQGLPRVPIPPNQISVAGGFFLATKDNVEWWAHTFDAKLDLYFQNGYLVKDDQMIIIDCVITENTRFKLHREDDPNYDNWFMFQRILL